jgi:hypothetical protein
MVFGRHLSCCEIDVCELPGILGLRGPWLSIWIDPVRGLNLGPRILAFQLEFLSHCIPWSLYSRPSGLWLDMWGPNQGLQPLSKDSIRDPLTNCTILGPRTVDLTCTFQEQLIVVEVCFLAARNKNSFSQAAHFFYIVKSSTKQYWLFLSRHKIGPYEGPKYIIPEQHKIIDFLPG